MTTRRTRLWLTAISACLLSGCAKSGPPLPPPPPPTSGFPRFLAVLTPGVTIYDEAGAWAIRDTDEPIPPPFRSEPLGVAIQSMEDLIDLYPRFQSSGARTVRVRVPGRDKPLYGLLALLPVMETTTERSAAHAYRVAVPPERVQQALGAQISIVAQPYEAAALTIGVEDGSTAGRGYPRRLVVTDAITGAGYYETYLEVPITGFSWLLWLSDAPFAGHATDWAEPGR